MFRSRAVPVLTRRILALLVVVAATPVAVIMAQAALGDGQVGHGHAADAAARVKLVGRGAELYALNCAVCHGATGGGLPEAKLAFPEDHRTCTRCHRPSNRIVQPLTEPFVDNDMFAIGDPPTLRTVVHDSDGGPATELQEAVVGHLGAVAPPSALLAYVAATMPRYDPGRLGHDEYVAITAHLLVLNDRGDEIDDLLQALRDPE